MIFSKIRAFSSQAIFLNLKLKQQAYYFSTGRNLAYLKDNYNYLNNYLTQEHSIKTQDNIELKCFRIRSKNASAFQKNTPVFMQHGLADSSDTWICNQQSKAPALILANQGYDVWLGNTRGNSYTNISRLKQWNFTFDQMAEYDVPASLEYINNQTNKPIHYVGHSQGTLVMFIGLSQYKNKVQKYIKSFSALGPVVYLQHQQSKFVDIATFWEPVLMKLKNPFKLQQSQAIFNAIFDRANEAIGGHLANISFLLPELKNIILQNMADKNPNVDNMDRINQIFRKSYPANTSINNFLHFIQYVKTGQFKKFDFGNQRQNTLAYGSNKVPQYDLAKINFPVHMFAGGNDLLASVKDAQTIDSKLINARKLQNQPRLRIYQEYGHTTFIWGKNYPRYMPDLISVFNSAQKSASA